MVECVIKGPKEEKEEFEAGKKCKHVIAKYFLNIMENIYF